MNDFETIDRLYRLTSNASEEDARKAIEEARCLAEGALVPRIDIVLSRLETRLADATTPQLFIEIFRDPRLDARGKVELLRARSAWGLEIGNLSLAEGLACRAVTLAGPLEVEDLGRAEFRYALILFNQHRIEESNRHYLACELYSQSPDFVVTAKVNRAINCLLEKAIDDAELLLEETADSIEGLPGTVIAHWHRALALTAQSKKDYPSEARHLEQVIKNLGEYRPLDVASATIELIASKARLGEIASATRLAADAARLTMGLQRHDKAAGGVLAALVRLGLENRITLAQTSKLKEALQRAIRSDRRARRLGRARPRRRPR